ncbi:hypothetical protein BDV23DRAFT_145312 [Aspergillus alliaceus]|uniref:BZIP domain-containing protein n=1 Tax=Petromyces alliaceus TaxID=209559 RepID=A0A5N7CPH5_PETAA|nr:hypothetical protein BDV23DRAFT_145312 [Aspergillus alliaceus]
MERAPLSPSTRHSRHQNSALAALHTFVTEKRRMLMIDPDNLQTDLGRSASRNMDNSSQYSRSEPNRLHRIRSHASLNKRTGYQENKRGTGYRGITEHRRIQMREAQRKYRFKKDATISVLQHRNAELENTLVAMRSTIEKIQDQIARLQQVEHKAEAMESLRTTAERLQADVAKAQRQPVGTLCVDGRSDVHHGYGVHSTLWQTTPGEKVSSRPVSALGYEILNA